MALIKCKSCGHVMSDRAEFCPHCGCPKESSAKEETWQVLNRSAKI